MPTSLRDPQFWRDFDWLLLLVALLLSAIGLVEIYSATLNMASASFFERQLIWVAVGVVVLFVIASLDYHVLSEHIPLIYGGTVLLLAGLLLFGRTVSGAQSWVGIGTLGIQPSEVAKLVAIIALARYFSGIQQKYLAWRQIFTAVAICGLPVLLVALQPDLGTALTFVPILAFGLFVRGVRPSAIAAGAGSFLLTLIPAWSMLENYQKDRILMFIQPETDPLGRGYQVIQSKIAIGAGGFWGTGLFEGSQNQLGFLPTRHTDFIFSVVAEELGFVGVMVTLALLMALIMRALAAAMKPRDTLGTFIVVGVVGMFVFHILVNVGMVIGFMPITGIPLPFLSYGGSSVLTAFAALGLVVSVRRCRYVN
jgi:rod shape determining protein RodA